FYQVPEDRQDPRCRITRGKGRVARALGESEQRVVKKGPVSQLHRLATDLAEGIDPNVVVGKIDLREGPQAPAASRGADQIGCQVRPGGRPLKLKPGRTKQRRQEWGPGDTAGTNARGERPAEMCDLSDGLQRFESRAAPGRWSGIYP